MSYQVKLINEAKGINITLRVNADEYILDMAEQKGYNLPVSCRAGACVTCTGRVIEGKLEQDHNFLKPKELNAGFALLCKASPRSDCVILTHQEDALLDL